eukprot:jgi/Chrpa1/16085/Chrysochromulina_OHIO_Genome00020891-RA
MTTFLATAVFAVLKCTPGDRRQCPSVGINAGHGVYDITGPSVGINFMGMANPNQKGTGIHIRLRARAFAFSSAEGTSPIAFVSLDAGMPGFVLKKRVLAALERELGMVYTEANLCISATHTHSGPSGFLEHTLFQFAGSGWVPQTLDAMVNGTTLAILRAHRSLAPADVRLGIGRVPNASISRSPTAYLLNSAAERAMYPEGDKDDTMVQLTIRTASGNASAIVNWHATHGTSMNNTNTLVSGDNKGWAAYLLERAVNGPTSDMRRVGDGPFVAAFAATALGDVSPNTRGARCRDTGLPCDAIHSTCNGFVQQCSSSGEGRDMFESTKLNAERQVQVASMLMHAADTQPALLGPVRAVHAFVKMPGLEVASAQGQPQHALCKAAMGVSFAAGTTDGPGMFNFEQGQGNSSNPFWRFIGDILHVATKEEQECQHPKAILLSTGSIAFPYPWAPDTAPIQLLQLGQLVIIAVPTEMTTMAGRRTRAAVKARLVQRGVLSDTEGVVVIAGLSNDYQDYTTTFEEYQQQRYEGGSTIYGPRQLDGYIQELLRLADNLANGTIARSDPPPVDFTDRIVQTADRPKLEAPPAGTAFGDVSLDVPSLVKAGQRVSVTFIGGSLNNDLRSQDTFARVVMARAGARDGVRAYGTDSAGALADWKLAPVGSGWRRAQHLHAADWELVAEDSDPETRVSAVLNATTGRHYDVTVSWDVPPDAPAGVYRIIHTGASWQQLGASEGAVPYSGTSSAFNVTTGEP